MRPEACSHTGILLPPWAAGVPLSISLTAMGVVGRGSGGAHHKRIWHAHSDTGAPWQWDKPYGMAGAGGTCGGRMMLCAWGWWPSAQRPHSLSFPLGWLSNTGSAVADPRYGLQ